MKHIKRLISTRGTVTIGRTLAKHSGLHDECTINPVHRAFGCHLPQWHVGRILAFPILHNLRHGVPETTLTLAFQAVQRIQVSNGASNAAAVSHADRTYRKLNASIARIASASEPTSGAIGPTTEGTAFCPLRWR